MKKRLYGLEVEFAPVFYQSEDNEKQLDNFTIYIILTEVLKEKFHTLPTRYMMKEGLFLENGIKVNYEGRGDFIFDGLIEFSTPECSSVKEVTLYQRLIDTIVENSVKEVEKRINFLGYYGELVFIKSSIDSEGHTFGSHENYLIDDSMSFFTKACGFVAVSSMLLFTFIYSNVVGIPFFVILILFLVVLLLSITSISVFYLFSSILSIIPGLNSITGRYIDRIKDKVKEKYKGYTDELKFKSSMEKLSRKLDRLMFILISPFRLYSIVCNCIALKKFQKHLIPFLVTREIYSGSGYVYVSDKSYSYKLSQKAGSINRLFKFFINDKNKPIVDTKHFLFNPFSLIKRYKKLHIMLSDSNMSEVSLYLKVGTTSLILDLIENGYLDDFEIELKNPIDSLKMIIDDTRFIKTVTLKDGREMTAIDIQFAYLSKAKQYLIDNDNVADDVFKLIKVWENTLKKLRKKSQLLENRIDWAIKKSIIKRLRVDGSAIDLPKWIPLIRKINQLIPLKDPLVVLENYPQFIHYIREFLENDEYKDLKKEFINLDLNIEDFNYFYLLYYRLKKIDFKYHFMNQSGYFYLLETNSVIERLFYPNDVENIYFTPPKESRAYIRGLLVKACGENNLTGKAHWNWVKLKDPLTNKKFKISLKDYCNNSLEKLPDRVNTLVKKVMEQGY